MMAGLYSFCANIRTLIVVVVYFYSYISKVAKWLGFSGDKIIGFTIEKRKVFALVN